MQKRRRTLPTMPVTAGPLWIPERKAKANITYPCTTEQASTSGLTNPQLQRGPIIAIWPGHLGSLLLHSKREADHGGSMLAIKANQV